MQKSVWIFGSIAGLFGAVLEFFYYNGDERIGLKSMYLGKMASLIICIVFALILIRKMAGVISISRTFFSGVLLSIIRAAILIAAFTYLHQPDGEFYQSRLDQALQQTEEKIRLDDNVPKGEKAEQIAEASSDVRRQFTPFGYGISTIISSIVTGFVISLLMAAFISTNMMYNE